MTRLRTTLAMALRSLDDHERGAPAPVDADLRAASIAILDYFATRALVAGVGK